ncbi:uncharacterized protein LOC128266449 [Drosophila gunungcola]|uniref:Uncharacterized protein n=1 Tax=Drosophila gunungcola TaxID=103775 RepID=A0A9P9YX32_9MUSC|nr:uncharacterized protein LOC128266449 [Drosophila gunungcola]KAI8044712.1 hypothetical protein M5D96_000883 [Drosophila gunungcola]
MSVQGFLLSLLVALMLLLPASVSGSPARGYYQSPARGGRSYTDIARVVNPNQYAFPGSRTYPGQPFWPSG